MERTWSGPPTRRQVIRAVGGAVGAVLGGGLLAGCASGGAAPSKPGPAVNQPVTQLVFMPWWIYWTGGGKQLLTQATASFEETHKGLRLTAVPGPQGGGIGTGTVIADILAGRGPDIVADCCTAWTQYMAINAFADLNPYLAQDNIPTSTWAKGQMNFLATTQGQFGLPVYNGPVVLAYRQDMLDQLGLAYPNPKWTYQEAAALWSNCAGEIQVNGKPQHRYGCNFLWYTNSFYAMEYLFHGFGGGVMDGTHTSSLLGESQSIAAAEWVFPLLWNGVLGASTGSLRNGTAVFNYHGGWSIPHDAENYRALKWSYVPMPQWPSGNATFSNNDYWGLVANGKNVDKAWEALRWLTYEDTWQQFVMRATLLPPSKSSLWSQFKPLLEAAAPDLKGRGLEYFVEAAQGGYGYPTEIWKYQNSTIDSLLGQTMNEIYTHKSGVTTALTTVSQKIDAIEQSGAAVAAAADKGQQQALKIGHSTKNTTLLPPGTTGYGTPPVKVPKLVTPSSGGIWTVVGAGGDTGGGSDNGTLAAISETASVGSWTCRLTQMVNISEPHPEPWCKLGIMARSDASNNAPMILLGVTSGNGIQLLYREMEGVGAASEAAGAKTNGGLIGQPTLTSSYSAKASNYLIHDVWLRLERAGDQWTASTSLDGTTFTTAYKPVTILMAGAWVGLWVCATNAGFSNGAGMQMKGVFDNVSFTPKTFYQIGTP